MTYLGDFTYQDEVHHLFTTRDSTGQPSSLSGASIAVYEDDNIAQQTGSMTITVDFDSVTGLNHVIVDTDDTFYLPVGDVGRNCSCVLTAGAVDGVTVTGEVLFTFSVQARYGASLTAQQVRDALKLAPSGGAAAAGSTDDQLATAQTDLDTITGADGVNLLTATQASIDAIETDTNSLNDTKVPNTLNTTASGNIGIDWANVENPTTALDLSATDIQLVDTCTTNTDMVGTDSAALAATLGSPAGLTIAADIAALPLAAEVNAEVVDVMKTDTIAEMAQGAPPTTPTFEEAVMYLYMALVHKVDVTAVLKEFHNNAGTVIWKKALSDDATTYTEAESASGP